MALTTEDQASILEEIRQILEVDVAEELHTFYAEVVASVQKHPEQANKELRDAMTHLGRAISAADAEQARSQVRQGRTHLERAKRDCLKMSLIFASTRLGRLCHEIAVEHGRIAANFVTRRRALRTTRRDIALAEAKGENDITLRMLGLLNKFADLEDDLTAEYSMPDKRLRWYRMPWRIIASFWRRHLWPILIGLALGIVSSLIVLVLVIDPVDFSKRARQMLGLSTALPAVQPALPSAVPPQPTP